ncbi:hypothetical protein Dimus_011178 [Dionaea muscipula]
MASTLQSIIPLHYDYNYQSCLLSELPRSLTVLPMNDHGATMLMLPEGAYPAAEIAGVDSSLLETDGMFPAPLLSTSCPELLFQWDAAALPTLPDCADLRCSQAQTFDWLQQNYAPMYSTPSECNLGIQELGVVGKSTRITVGKYSAEEKRDRILRYLKKRNHRNFNKTIKYACRKTLADRRTRVRGRFAKNQAEEMTMMSDSASSDEEKLSNPCGFAEKMKTDCDQWLQEAIASLLYIPCNINPANL